MILCFKLWQSSLRLSGAFDSMLDFSMGDKGHCFAPFTYNLRQHAASVWAGGGGINPLLDCFLLPVARRGFLLIAGEKEDSNEL